MRFKVIFFLVIAVLSANNYSAEAKNRMAKHVIFIGLDGWGAYSYEKADMPNTKQLAANGSYTLQKRSELPSSSAVNWASMFMGANAELHGYTDWGSKTPDLPSRVLTHYGMFPSIFGLLRDASPDAVIGCVHEWDGIPYLMEQKALNFSRQAKKDSITPIACDYIKNAKPNLFAVIYDDPDHAGHESGHDTPEYYAELKKLDALIGQIIQATKDAGIIDETVFIITSDHGGINKGHGGKTMLEMETPFIISGKNIRKGKLDISVMQYDVASTIAAIFGLQQPQVWIGRPMPVFGKSDMPKIICHRGYWNTAGSAQNSIASLARAQELRQKYGDAVYGAEFDVWITKDGVSVLNHDATIDNLNIENSNYKAIKNKTLGNGEKIPTFAAYLKQGKKNPHLKLVCEIKTHNSRENNNRAVDAVIQMVKDVGMESQVEYLAFDWQNCLRIHEKMPDALVGYLNNDKDPQALFDTGIMCVDYSMDTWKNNNAWVRQARDLGMVSNVWTVNSAADMQYFTGLGVDFITTDYPEEVEKLLNACEVLQ